jgi:hypothetical protein
VEERRKPRSGKTENGGVMITYRALKSLSFRECSRTVPPLLIAKAR